MKICLLAIILILSPALSADPLEGKPKPSQEKHEKMPVSKTQGILVITEAKLVPLMEFLGLPDVNKLPPTSAGKTKIIDHQID